MIVYYSDQHHLHDTTGITFNGSPFISEEPPDRLDCLLGAIRATRAAEIQPPRDFGLQPVLDVHDPDYVDYLRNIYQITQSYNGVPTPVFPGTFAPREFRRKSTHPDSLPGYYCFGTYTPILEGTWQAAYWSAQCALSAAAALMDGEPHTYALCRPPGHHAARAMYGGYCYLNNAAIAAQYLKNSSPAHRTKQHTPGVAILDIDYHHGNGTQEIFYTDPGVVFCSIHADPDQDYPYFWGSADECGDQEGQGFNYNWPLPRGTGDLPYMKALDEALRTITHHQVSYLVVSLGFDTGENDPAGGFKLTTHAFREIASRIVALGLPVMLVQEGGYLLDRLQEWASAFLQPFVTSPKI
jgi:acetoin utilization deacetylase AcuC-like enzyme